MSYHAHETAIVDDGAQLPVGDTVAQKVLRLPMHPYLGVGAQQQIAKAFGQER